MVTEQMLVDFLAWSNFSVILLFKAMIALPCLLFCHDHDSPPFRELFIFFSSQLLNEEKAKKIEKTWT